MSNQNIKDDAKVSVRVKQEIFSFSLWFRVLFIIAFIIYLSLWIFSIYLSSIQKAKGFEPVLPGAPKDSGEYILLSESLINGSGLSIYGHIETLRGPGYPLFTAIIKTMGRSYFAVTLVQIFLVFGSALVIRRIGVLFSGKTVGEIAATLLLINPVTMTIALLILTDTLFLFLFTLGVYQALLLDKEKWVSKIFVISFLFASAIYVRGMGFFALPIFIAPFLASKIPFKLQIKSIATLALLIVLSVIPWVVRNYIQTGVASWNSFESTNLSWIVPKFLSSLSGAPESKETADFQKATGVPESAWQDLSWHDIRYSKQINAVGEKIILERPFSYLKFHIVSSMPFLFPSSILFAKDVYNSVMHQETSFKYGSINDLIRGDFKSFYQGILAVWWKFAERILWLLGIFVAIYAVWKDRKNFLVWVFVFIIGYLMLLSGPAAGPRLSFQAWPFMFVLFAEGVVILFQKFFRSHSKVG